MKRCQMQIGTIVSHPCAARAEARCPMCSGRYCRRHVDLEAGTCLRCSGAYRPPDAPVVLDMDELLAFDEDDRAAFAHQPDVDMDVTVAHLAAFDS